jgi:putative phosphoribosyl transferase
MIMKSSQLELGNSLDAGELCLVPGARGLVVFVQGEGGARTTRRSQNMAARLQSRGLNTLVFDLLTEQEAGQPGKLEDVDLLAQRLMQTLDALPVAQRELPLGLLGSGPGAAAALVVAASRPQTVRALVLRGGRPDLAAEVLGDVHAPTLLLVGAADTDVLEINRRAYARLRCEKGIDTVPRATHLFLEAGTLDVVTQRAGDWFCAHLGKPMP